MPMHHIKIKNMAVTVENIAYLRYKLRRNVKFDMRKTR